MSIGNNNSYTVFEWQIPQNRNIVLNTNINEFYTIGTAAPNSNEEQRQALIDYPIIYAVYRCSTDDGAHDAEIVCTCQVNALASVPAKVITFPASGGAAIFTDTNHLPLTTDDLLAWEITGGGGAGTTTIRAESWSFIAQGSPA